MSEIPTQGRRPRREGDVLAVTTVTEEELALLDFSSWKADQWLEDAVELEMRFGIGPDGARIRAPAPAPPKRPLLYRVMEWLLVCNLTLVVVMLLLYGKGDGASRGPPGPLDTVWERAFTAARDGEPLLSIELLERHLRTPSLSEFERSLAYEQLAFYLVRVGRFEEAGECERLAHAAVQAAAPPR